MPPAKKKIPSVLVDDVSKSFHIPKEQMHTLKERALHPFRNREFNSMHALHDVSFAVPRGSFYALAGRNGSGKSTMLKCIAGIYGVDKGRIYADGRMSTFIELGVGFNPDLAARDNVLLNAAMLGLSRKEARNRFDSIIDFAELHEFVDLKIKNYSSGMLVRLAFSVMIQVDADILLIDEVLAVGDANFQKKCEDEFTRIKKSNATVIFVTHEMKAMRTFCDAGVLLERGHIVEVGDIEKVCDKYNDLNFSEEARDAAAADRAAIDAREAEEAAMQVAG